MADVLSQSEVESLLAALAPQAHSKRQAPATTFDRRQNAVAGQAAIYDFNPIGSVNSAPARAHDALNEDFAREFAATLGGMLRSIVEVKFVDAEELTYGEFVAGVDEPICCNVLHSKGLDGPLLLNVNASILFPIIDRLLGGGKTQTHAVPARPLTDIELKLVSRTTNLALRALEKAWHNVCDLQLELARVEGDPQHAPIVGRDEVVVVNRFEIAMGERRGPMNLCIPFRSVERLAGKLLPGPRHTNAPTGVNMVVQLGETRLSAQEVANLAVGDIIMTEHATTEGLQVLIEGRVLFDGVAGVLKGHKAIRIRNSITQPEGRAEESLRSPRAISDQQI